MKTLEELKDIKAQEQGYDDFNQIEMTDLDTNEKEITRLYILLDATEAFYTQEKEKYYLSTDQDCHWYIVPVSKKEEWDKWVNLDQESEEAWTPPSFAQSVSGDPSQVIFENPINK